MVWHLGNAGEGSMQRFGSNVVNQALCHEMVCVHVGQCLKEGSAASPTKVAFALDDNPNMLISDGNIHVQLRLDLMSVDLGMSTVSAARRRSDQLRPTHFSDLDLLCTPVKILYNSHALFRLAFLFQLDLLCLGQLLQVAFTCIER